jgi:hypothetical protein
MTTAVRPRYFAGQLLSEVDLRDEQAYQIAKQRLHNRYLHGYGVVCGLQVQLRRLRRALGDHRARLRARAVWRGHRGALHGDHRRHRRDQRLPPQARRLRPAGAATR